MILAAVEELTNGIVSGRIVPHRNDASVPWTIHGLRGRIATFCEAKLKDREAAKRERERTEQATREREGLAAGMRAAQRAAAETQAPADEPPAEDVAPRQEILSACSRSGARPPRRRARRATPRTGRPRTCRQGSKRSSPAGRRSRALRRRPSGGRSGGGPPIDLPRHRGTRGTGRDLLFCDPAAPTGGRYSSARGAHDACQPPARGGVKYCGMISAARGRCSPAQGRVAARRRNASPAQERAATTRSSQGR